MRGTTEMLAAEMRRSTEVFASEIPPSAEMPASASPVGCCRNREPEARCDAYCY